MSNKKKKEMLRKYKIEKKTNYIVQAKYGISRKVNGLNLYSTWPCKPATSSQKM